MKDKVFHITNYFFLSYFNLDRDEHINVHLENIQEASLDQFNKCSNTSCWNTYGTPYDCDSIMHYDGKSFSKNSKETMTPVDPDACDLSNFNINLSDTDIQLLQVSPSY